MLTSVYLANTIVFFFTIKVKSTVFYFVVSINNSGVFWKHGDTDKNKTKHEQQDNLTDPISF